MRPPCLLHADADRRAVAVLIACVLIGIGPPAAAAPDDPDRAFGSAGVVAVALKGTAALRIVVDERNRIVLSLRQEYFIGPFDPSSTPVLTRLLEDGSPDLSFGVGGAVSMRSICPHFCEAHDLVAQPGGGYVMLSHGRVYWIDDRGTLEAVADSGLFSPPARTFAVDRTGAVLVAARFPVDYGYEQESPVTIVRIVPDGSRDPYFGVAGRATLEFVAEPVAIQVLPDSRALVAWDEQGLKVVRLRPNGVLDPSFGIGGAYEESGPEAVRPVSMLRTENGDIFIAGWSTVLNRERGTILKLTSDGKRDLTFGTDGRVSTHGADGESQRNEVRRVVVDGSGRLVALLRVNKSRTCPAFCDERVYIARWHANGTPDSRFAAHGANFFQSAVDLRGEDLAMDAKGRAVVAGAIEHQPVPNPYVPSRFEPQGQAAVFRVEGGETALPRTVRESRACEFFHAGFGHYFVTSGSRESNLLVSVSGSWALTGRSFKVWSENAAGVAPVCRFWSDQSFAPKSSHFYTPFSTECLALKSGEVWRFEPDTFYLGLPEGVRGSASCPPGSQPLYRAYNNGIGGAPNHRYTTDAGVLDEMIAAGWTMEGEAQTRVFACVPLQDR